MGQHAVISLLKLSLVKAGHTAVQVMLYRRFNQNLYCVDVTLYYFVGELLEVLKDSSI